MMWAPIANNVISVAVLATYLLVYGPVQDLCGPASTRRCCPDRIVVGGYTPGQELLLGLGLDARHRAAAADPAALPAAAPASRSGPASTSAAPASGTRCGSASGPCCSWSSTRSPTPSWSGSPPRAPRTPSHGGAGGGAGHRLHDLLQRVPAGDGAARDRRRSRWPPRCCRGSRRTPRTPTCAGSARSVASTLRTAYALIIPFALLLAGDRARPVQHRSSGYGAGRPSVPGLRGGPRAVRAGPGVLHRRTT